MSASDHRRVTVWKSLGIFRVTAIFARSGKSCKPVGLGKTQVVPQFVGVARFLRNAPAKAVWARILVAEFLRYKPPTYYESRRRAIFRPKRMTNPSVICIGDRKSTGLVRSGP